MKLSKFFAIFLSLALMLSLVPLTLVSAAPTSVFINEIHYDNVGDDLNEAVEIAGPAGTNLSGWSIALYNGSATQLNVYDTIDLSGVIPDQENGYGTLAFPRAGIQNGAPDGLALVDDSSTVVQFLCYEGTFTAGSGPAAGMTCADIGVSESSSTLADESLQLTGNGTTYDDFTWAGPETATFGAVNTGQTFGTGSPTPPLPPDFVSIHDIQYTANASGDSPYAGQTITTEGIVTGFFYNGGNKYTFIQDGTGPWSGLVLYKPDAFINVGDKLQVHGDVSEYSGLTEIANGTATVLSSGNPLPAPEKLSSGDVSQEMWEAVLVRVENVRVTNPDLGYGEWQVDDGSGGVVVDDLGFYGYAPVVDDLLPFVQGPLYYSFGAFKIEPRDDSDIGAPIEILPIGTVQGSVGNSDDGATFASPYTGQTVTIQGVIYEKLISRVSSGSSTYAFFIQNTAATADADPNSSDGVYVYIGYYSTLRMQGGGYYTPQVGDEVVLQGPVSEYYGLTEFYNPYLISKVRSGADIDAEILPFEVNPPADLAEANRYWERHEGMRGSIPADSIVLNGRNVFASTADAEVWVARSDSTIGLRTDLYTNRAFRDAHPLDDNYDPNVWDGNGYRILMGSLGIKAAKNDNTAMIAPARTFDTLTSPAVGGLYYGYSKYTIQVEAQVDFGEGVDPALNAPPQSFDRSQEYSVVDYNLENLYDYRNNPKSGCDFASDTGCSNADTPFLSPITPSFDYVPENDAVYQARLNDIALQIINNLHSPDILMVQEVENQDICSVSGGALVCDTIDGNPDGKPDVLQELALKIVFNGGPAYDAAFDPDSSDLRGIAPAFMYRTDSVELLSPVGDPVLGTNPAIPGFTSVPYDSDVSNPKTLNAELPSGVSACETSWVFPRAPGIGLFRIWRDGIGSSVFTDVYVVNNHFKSGPDSCVAHRTEQAKYNAAIVSFLQAAKPNARIVVGGDLNVYPRPDDIGLNPDGTLATDQLGSLYDPSLGLTNLWNVLLSQEPQAAYSYVYVGMAQTLDQMFANGPMMADLQQFRSAHINSDFPADYPGDVARGTSDHDPQFAAYSNLPTLDRLTSLVMYYDANGMITGNNTTTILLDHLEKAARYKANGQLSAYDAQLQAFINQVQGKAPQFVTQDAADALSKEAALLRSLP